MQQIFCQSIARIVHLLSFHLLTHSVSMSLLVLLKTECINTVLVAYTLYSILYLIIMTAAATTIAAAATVAMAAFTENH